MYAFQGQLININENSQSQFGLQSAESAQTHWRINPSEKHFVFYNTANVRSHSSHIKIENNLHRPIDLNLVQHC